MTWNKNHPARSHAFLSRLHDCDLEPSERAHFEAHRAHCAACRTAAADYERALSLFRSVRSSPPPADMANRVLRKLQTFPPSRRTPFGNLFAVDWRWAGAFAAALLVLLIGAPFALKQQDKAARTDSPIAVALQDRETGAAAPSAPVPDQAPRNAPGEPAPGLLRKQAARAPAPPASRMAEDSRQAQTDFDKVETAAETKAVSAEEKLEAQQRAASQKPQANARDESQAFAQSPPAGRAGGFVAQNQANDRQAAQNRTSQNAAPSPASQSQNQERSGGEGAREPVLVAGGGVVLDRPTRIMVQVLDALGSVPEVVARPEEPDLTPLRGRSFVLLVDASGQVRDVRESADKKIAEAESRRRDPQVSKEKDAAADPLKRLRFRPVERPRRVLVRIE